MNLSFFNNLSNNLKENGGIQSFIKELGEFLEQATSKVIQSPTERNAIGILEEIQCHRNMSVVSRNEIRKGMDEILAEYASKTKDKGSLYFISSKSKKAEDVYTVYHYENGEEKSIRLTEKDLPRNAGVNSVLRMENGEYVLDEQTTESIIKEITEMTNDVLDKQDNKLKEYRKEGHLYMVEEDVNNRIYLWDLTDKPDNTIEEVDFPKELIKEATEGTVFQYLNGEYHFYSNDGFERIEES